MEKHVSKCLSNILGEFICIDIVEKVSVILKYVLFVKPYTFN